MQDAVGKQGAPGAEPGVADAVTLLDSGLAFQRAGRFSEAEAAYRQILDKMPEHADALHLMGLLSLQAGNHAVALEMIDRAIDQNEGNANAWSNRGAVLLALGRAVEAEESYRRAIGLNPRYAGAYCNIGQLLLSAGRLSEAEQSYRLALEIDPGNATAHFNLGRVLKACYRLQEASAELRQALQLKPDYPEAHCSLALVLKESGNRDEAEAAFRSALSCRPDDVNVLTHLGNLYWEMGRIDEAERSFRRVLEIAPVHAEVYSNLGSLLQNTGRHDEAEQNLRRALDLDPIHAGALLTLGIVFKETGRLDEAEQCLRRTLELNPEHPEGLINLGLVFKASGRLDEAERSYRQALSISPGHPRAHWNLALVTLLKGRFRDGWAEYETRMNVVPTMISRPDVAYPEWRGEPLAGCRLLLVGEQGLGDQIQFIRYASLLQQQGARVDVVIAPPFARLAKIATGVENVFSTVPADTYDYWSLMLSVPGRVGTDLGNIPTGVPYLTADADRVLYWRSRIDAVAKGRKKVGIVWAGNRLHRNDRFRSMTLNELGPLAAIEHVAWFSLQKGEAQAQLTEAGSFNEHALGEELKDLAETAAVIESLDLVISVDTSVLHLAGALGQPAWGLLCADPDWRWLARRADSVWYPTIRLFRQARLGDWAPVMAEVSRELQRIGA
jgi:tetratricopeptide (TPR) repeat protein